MHVRTKKAVSYTHLDVYKRQELDMVINIGKLLGGDEDYVRDEIRQIVQVAHEAGALVKVILETCYLTDAQKVTACHLSEEAGADFVKTRTGYGTKGCTIQDLQLDVYKRQP